MGGLAETPCLRLERSAGDGDGVGIRNAPSFLHVDDLSLPPRIGFVVVPSTVPFPVVGIYDDCRWACWVANPLSASQREVGKPSDRLWLEQVNDVGEACDGGAGGLQGEDGLGKGLERTCLGDVPWNTHRLDADAIGDLITPTLGGIVVRWNDHGDGVPTRRKCARKRDGAGTGCCLRLTGERRHQRHTQSRHGPGHDTCPSWPDGGTFRRGLRPSQGVSRATSGSSVDAMKRAVC